MNPAQLLAHFDRVAETPDAVPRLRRFILDLAVRGRLAEQDSRDEPARELLARIRKARTQGQKFKKAPLPAASAEGNRAPRGLETVRFGDLFLSLQTGPFGSSLHQQDYEIGGIPVINPASIQKERIVPIGKMCVGPATLERLAVFKLRWGDVVMGRRGEMGRAAVVTDEEDGWLCGTGSLVLRFTEDISPWFIVKMLAAPSIRDYLGGASVGATMQNLNQSILCEMTVGLPPLAEQHRIVAKVDELMALCNELEAAQAKREKRRDRLVAATLHGLNNGDASAEPGTRPTFEESARFTFHHLPRLTTRPEHVQQFRKTILNLAVQGKLVPQHSEDAPIEGFIDVPRGERLFEIPRSWRWVRFQDLGEIRGGGTPSKGREDLWGGEIPWVSPKDMKRDYVASALFNITPKALEESAVRLIDQGSILFVVRGMILAHSFPVALSRVSLTVNQDMKAVTLRDPQMGEFVLRALKGLRREILSKVQRSSHGTCRLESSDYQFLPFPLPPLAEQQRIVAKVDELMALCDALEAQLTTTANTSRQLLEAVLHQVLDD